MRVIHDSKRLRVIIPSTNAEWLTIAMGVCGILSFMQGDMNTGWHFLQMGMLVLIADGVSV